MGPASFAGYGPQTRLENLALRIIRTMDTQASDIPHDHLAPTLIYGVDSFGVLGLK